MISKDSYLETMTKRTINPKYFVVGDVYILEFKNDSGTDVYTAICMDVSETKVGFSMSDGTGYCYDVETEEVPFKGHYKLINTLTRECQQISKLVEVLDDERPIITKDETFRFKCGFWNIGDVVIVNFGARIGEDLVLVTNPGSLDVTVKSWLRGNLHITPEDFSEHGFEVIGKCKLKDIDSFIKRSTDYDCS